MKKNKPTLFIFLFLFVLFVMGKTIAYYQTSDSFNNSFSAAGYIMEVKETFVPPTNWLPGDTTPKTIIATNRGDTPAAVRVKLTPSWEDTNGDPLPLQYNGEDVAIINFTENNKWVYEDGYYYYKYLLNKDESTTSLIESVTFNPNVSLETTTTCTINNETHQKTCTTTANGYNGGKYKLNIEIETVQYDKYEEAWNTEVVINKSKYLYDVLKKESKRGIYAKKYTGSHQDSYDASGDKDIYYWAVNYNTNGSAITDQYNVIFGNHCWQMLRTTDTGGVKMIYNGEVENNQCLNTRGTHVGYSSVVTQTLSSNYYYSSDYTYDKTNNVFSLSGNLEQATWNDSTYKNLIGKYTCKGTTNTATCSTLYLVESYKNNTQANVIQLKRNATYYSYGVLEYNFNYNSPSYVGYMYNKSYPRKSKEYSFNKSVLTNTSLSTNYWYSDSIRWNTSRNYYELVNPYKVSSSDDYPNLVGKYTFRNSNETYNSSTVTYIANVNSGSMYYVLVSNTPNHNLQDVNDTYTYGESYTDNEDGTYTINNPTTFNRINWFSNYSNVSQKFVCINATNNTCSNLMYATSTTDTTLHYSNPLDKYASGFTYNSSTNTYTLNSDSVTFWNTSDNTNITSLNSHHYTCFNESGVCQTLLYIYYISINNPKVIQYIELKNGKSVNDALNEMLYANDVNQNNSTIKTGIDAWYEKYMLPYNSFIEDTIYCNDRSIYELNGWNPTNGNLQLNLKFKEYFPSEDLGCTNDTDKFSTLNNKAKLKYKVGLMSSPELNILEKNILNNFSYYWVISPHYLEYYVSPSDTDYSIASVKSEDSNASLVSQHVNSSNGVRPAISLIPGIEYISGDGSKESPYIVDTN